MFKTTSTLSRILVPSGHLRCYSSILIGIRNFATEKKYTKDHEWVAVEKDVAIVGITDYAQKALGDVVFVDLPEIGAKVSQKGKLAAVESIKAASDVYAPISGEVVSINDKLKQDDTIKLVNTSPETEGWFAKLKLGVKANAELKTLMNEKDYKKYLETAH